MVQLTDNARYSAHTGVSVKLDQQCHDQGTCSY